MKAVGILKLRVTFKLKLIDVTAAVHFLCYVPGTVVLTEAATAGNDFCATVRIFFRVWYCRCLN